MALSSQDIIKTLTQSIEQSATTDEPYKNWLLKDCLPVEIAEDIVDIPFPAPDLGGVSGKRELHNATRTYFDEENQKKYPSCSAFAQALQDPQITSLIAKHFGTDLEGTYLRIEYAQDTDGFWLEPHTDLGVKLFTMLLYLSPEESHKDLGTDIYDSDQKHLGRSPFAQNTAFVFVPSDITYHGFEKRPIEGIRKSIIINYVSNEWRAREQLAFPQNPIGAAQAA